MNELKGCCFTGHRPDKLPWGYDERDVRCIHFQALLSDVIEVLYEQGYRRFLCGMAMGADMLFAEAVITFRREHPDVILEAAIPFPGQASRWSRSMRQRYDRLLQAADETTVLCPQYTKYCMMARNRYMVDNSSLLLAAYNGAPGGTKNTVNYAIQKKLQVIQLPLF
jgi:uncharacterized phage-like protein YoqJ